MNNNLSGGIPVSLGSLRSVTYLNLYNNKFHGTLPKSFQYLTELAALDVGENKLRDTLPTWTGEQLPNLRYLFLRSNNFYGEIPPQLCDHSQIQVLNLAQNKITGGIPPCFGNFSAIKSGISSDDYYQNLSWAQVRMIINDVKGYELKYTSTLQYLFSIDLSNNYINGKIPEELINLHGLLNINLAGNYLSGRIPDRIGDLKSLESLDLSRNELNGPIPQSLSGLNFLSRLNLSFNALLGRIPTGNQLQTLNDFSIYVGNNQLCGQPVLKPCDTESHTDYGKNEADYVSDTDSDSERRWLCAGIGPGLLVGFMGFCASLHFINSWRYLYFQFVEGMFDKVALTVALLRRKFHN
ncbi:hypothetical protein AgCh_002383 [Apium graveolens]